MPNLKFFTLLALFSCLIIFTPAGLRAQGMHDHNEHGQAQDMDMAMGGSVHEGHGVIQNVNAQVGDVEIAHEAMDSLGWGPMNMRFQVPDKSLLSGLKIGDKVRFDLEVDQDQSGQMTYKIVDMEKEKE
jgi:Cu(I)/Ag(I) efflux system protein CusF